MKKKIIIGVSGGIASYKSADLASKLVQHGMDVNVCMTPNSEKFITPLTFSAITGKETYTDKTIIDEKNNLQINELNLSMENLVSDILSSQILDNEEKCILLYETTNYIGDNLFDYFNKDSSLECSRDEALRISKRNSGTIEL